MRDHPNFLFAGVQAHAVVQRNQTRALDQLKTLDENTILIRPTEDLVAELISNYTLHIPELHEHETWVEEYEVTREVRNLGYDIYTDREGGSHTATSHIVGFHVPFDGDESFFTIWPSRRSIPTPAAELAGQELIIRVSTDDKTEAQVRQEFEGSIQRIKDHLSTLRNDLQHATTQIEAPARAYINQRKEQLLKQKSLVASLGFPMKRRSEAPTTYTAPEIRRKLTPVKPQIVPAFKPEPALDEPEYQHILSVMENMTKVMERSPHTFQQMGEEDIRQHFLVQLNSQYEGQASGETFNFQGKTDILIRSEGRNIFIAECKFWHGKKGLLETVDQLLSYLSWRDTKTAAIIFNRNKNLSGVLTSIREVMEEHPHKKRGPIIEGETRFRYAMGNPGDHNREIIMTVMVYDIPMPSTNRASGGDP
jgi:hypothetical protein